MELKWAKIDENTASIDEIKDEIQRLESLKNLKWGMEQGIKIFINSIYGALASIFFAGYNTRIAEAITLQGQELTKYAKRIIDRYFTEMWYKDIETHKKMGITGPVTKVLGEATVYGDTDSVASDSLIPTETGDFTIETLYNMGKSNMGGTLNGHESVSCDINILNWDEATQKLIWQKPKRIIRHKVTKPKWRVLTKSGKEVFVTGDHSLVIWRDGIKYDVTAKEIKEYDRVLETTKNHNLLNYQYEFIEVCEQVGDFQDEYVYDIEMEDNHTFFANDILVHNSVYVSFWEAMQSCNWQGTANEFILQLTENRLQEYINKCFDIYADKVGCDNNLQQLELEKIADSAIILAKKKYVLDITWKEPDNYYEPLAKLTSSGVEIVQSSTPAFAREKLNVMLKEIFKYKEKLKMSDFVKMLNGLKDEFKLADIQDISMSSSIGDYEKFILNDRNVLEIGSGCPIHVRGAGIYNYLLNKSKFKSKYNLITSGDKIKYYYAVSPDKNPMFNAFGYLSGNYPYEIAPPMDFDMQFQKTMVDPLSRFTVAMGYGPIPETLISTKKLF